VLTDHVCCSGSRPRCRGAPCTRDERASGAGQAPVGVRDDADPPRWQEPAQRHAHRPALVPPGGHRDRNERTGCARRRKSEQGRIVIGAKPDAGRDAQPPQLAIHRALVRATLERREVGPPRSAAPAPARPASGCAALTTATYGSSINSTTSSMGSLAGTMLNARCRSPTRTSRCASASHERSISSTCRRGRSRHSSRSIGGTTLVPTPGKYPTRTVPAVPSASASTSVPATSRRAKIASACSRTRRPTSWSAAATQPARQRRTSPMRRAASASPSGVKGSHRRCRAPWSSASSHARTSRSSPRPRLSNRLPAGVRLVRSP